jgi:hypothetical protein
MDSIDEIDPAVLDDLERFAKLHGLTRLLAAVEEERAEAAAAATEELVFDIQYDV